MNLERLAALPLWLKVLALGVITVVLYNWLRLGWMIWQARAAMAREMLARNLTVKSIRREQVFRDCGSIWAAVCYSGLDYDLVVCTHKGVEQRICFEALFVPVIGRLRAVRVLVPKRLLEGGGMEYHCPEEEEPV